MHAQGRTLIGGLLWKGASSASKLSMRFYGTQAILDLCTWTMFYIFVGVLPGRASVGMESFKVSGFPTARGGPMSAPSR